MRFKAAVSSINPLSEHMEEVWVGCVYMQKMELNTIGGCKVTKFGLH